MTLEPVGEPDEEGQGDEIGWPEGVVMSRVEIRRTMTADGRDIIMVARWDESEEDLSLLETLGLLEFAKDSVIRECMGEGGDD